MTAFILDYTRIMETLALCFCLLLSCSAEKNGQPEMTEHGGGHHESFNQKHYKDGQHDAHKDHEAVLGSKKLAEEYDQMSPDESKLRLRKLAVKMDRNGDGSVDESELYSWIHDHMKKLDAEEVEERFDEADNDKDGFVTWDEYRKESFGDGQLDEEDQKLLDEDAEYFKSADLNQDDKLSKVEYAAFQNPEHHQHMHDSVIRSTLNERDANKDGIIDVNEFMGDYADKKDSEWYTAEKSRFVEQYDSNRDGKLNKDEMKKWLIPDMSDAAREETRHLFDEADKNRDGQLTIDEIVDAYSIFVGSEATNYGEHLTRHVEL